MIPELERRFVEKLADFMKDNINEYEFIYED